MTTYADTMWADLPQARAHWLDSGPLDDDKLTDLLTIATDQCKAYAPVMPDADEIPVRYALATVYQAREVYAAEQRGDASDVIGVGDYVIRARPLTAAVKQLLRPQTRVPVVG